LSPASTICVSGMTTPLIAMHYPYRAVSVADAIQVFCLGDPSTCTLPSAFATSGRKSMKKTAAFILLSLALSANAFSQSESPSKGNPAFTQAELDQMLAPVALYPDALLSQILMASTYPLEIVQAERWSQANPKLKGEAAVQAAQNEDWDPSVRSLVAFPQVLQTMDQKLNWTERMGDAFLAQQAQVMDTVQELRQKAQQAGNLRSNAEDQVQQNNGAIEIDPVNPELVYVPYYDPSVVYGPWWWAQYPPMFWSPWAGYGWDGDFAWGLGFGVGADFFFGGWDWRHHGVFVNDHNHWFHGQSNGGGSGQHTWQHDPGHRHGVPYRSASLNQQFGRVTPSAESRQEYRGHQLPTDGGGVREAPNAGMRGQAPVEPNPHAFEGIGRGSDVRSFSARGHQSSQGAPSRSAPSRSAAPSARHR